MKHCSNYKRRYFLQYTNTISPLSIKNFFLSLAPGQLENEFMTGKQTGPDTSLWCAKPDSYDPLVVNGFPEAEINGRNIFFLRSTEGFTLALSHRGKSKIVQPAKFSYFKILLCVLFLIMGGSLSFLRAQKFDPALVGASYVSPLQMADWPLKIGPEAQLFVDDFLIHSMSKVVRIDHQPKKYEDNPVLAAYRANGTIIYDKEVKQYRMYYDNGHRVAFSNDGLHWTKPSLGIVLFNGSTENNLIMDYSYSTGLASFIYDPRDPDPDRRWKAAVYFRDKKENPEPVREGLYALFSSDGLHWKRNALLIPGINDNPTKWPMEGIDDVSAIVWNKRLGKFIAWLKIWDLTDGRFYRSRAMAVSDDFIHWSQPWAVFLADKLDPPDMQFYGMTGWSYESMWLGTLRVYHSATSTQQVDFQLATSRDGIHWARAAKRGLFIPNGPEGSYDHGYHTDFSNPPIRFGDELFFYYASTAYGKAGVPTDLKTGVCLAKLRVDGFASLHAKSISEPAYVITRPMVFTGSKLYLNTNALKGKIQVEVLCGDQENDLQPVLGFTIKESVPIDDDSIEQLVTWKSNKDLSSLAGKRIRLKFHLNGLAGLYSFKIR